MKQLLTLCFATFLVSSAFSQPNNKYLVRFTDRKNSPYSFSNPIQYLSQKAIDRRTRYNISLDSTDLPVNPDYVQQVKAQGAITYFDQSRWLNQILIHTTDQNAINKIKALSFVDTVMQMHYPNLPIAPTRNKFEAEKVTPVSIAADRTANASENFNYGATYPQIHFHNGEFLHQKGFAGEGMTIAFLDDGFNKYKTVPAFDSIRNHNQILGIRDFVAFDNSVNEDDAHGCETLSTIASNMPGQMVGSAPHANFYLLRTEDINSEYPIEEHNWVVGAEFADSAGADLITSSLGYTQFDQSQFDHTYNDFYKNSTMISKGATRAAQKGMIVTVSAGNYGGDQWKYIGFPADADSVCAVGATDTAKHIAYFSSYGYPGKVKPNIVSVGQGTVIYSPFGGVSTGDGTSFSNPNINGLIACLWQAFPQFNNMQILNAVYQNSSKYARPNARFGFGIPNMKKAYRSLKDAQNRIKYGNSRLFASQSADGSHAEVKLIAAKDGDAMLYLLNQYGIAVSSIALNTEEEEVYDYTFDIPQGISGNNFSVEYVDENTTQTISLNRKENTATDWLHVFPTLFDDQLTVELQVPENSTSNIRLLDITGKSVEQLNRNLTKDQSYTISFDNLNRLPAGIYYLTYTSQGIQKTVKLIKE